MCNSKVCNWIKSLFGKKCECDHASCCGAKEKKTEETVAPTTEATEVK